MFSEGSSRHHRAILSCNRANLIRVLYRTSFFTLLLMTTPRFLQCSARFYPARPAPWRCPPRSAARALPNSEVRALWLPDLEGPSPTRTRRGMPMCRPQNAPPSPLWPPRTWHVAAYCSWRHLSHAPFCRPETACIHTFPRSAPPCTLTNLACARAAIWPAQHAPTTYFDELRCRVVQIAR